MMMATEWHGTTRTTSVNIREAPLHLKFGEHQSKLLTAQNHTRTI